MALQLQATTIGWSLQSTKHCITSSYAPAGSVGQRRPSRPLALKSSFFFGWLNHPLSPNHQLLAASGPPRITMRVASKQAYICRDCGYIYNERTPFEKLPDKYFFPDVTKARKAEIQRDEAIGKALPIAIAVGVVALAGLYFYLNSTF